jgi:cytochrome c peroxidase
MLKTFRFAGRFNSSTIYQAASFALVAFIALTLAACQQSNDVNMPQAAQNPLIVPAGFPMPPVPADNPITTAKVALGRDLFYEKNLSFNNTQSCASCHSVTQSFSNQGKPVSVGARGEGGSRNAPGLMNVAYDTVFFWDGRATTLEMQAGMPIINPVELGNDSGTVVATLSSKAVYQELFSQAFGGPDASGQNITFKRIEQAIATFERTLISGGSAYDRYMQGDASALSASAKNGLALFDSNITNCSSCHSGINFTDNSYHSTGIVAFYEDDGREDVTGSPNDDGKFRTPSLRNVALTFPYMHDGSFKDLPSILAHYVQGGMHNSTQDSLIRPLNLTGQQVNDIIAFLNSLTDSSFTQRTDFKNPNLLE